MVYSFLSALSGDNQGSQSWASPRTLDYLLAPSLALDPKGWDFFKYRYPTTTNIFNTLYVTSILTPHLKDLKKRREFST